MDNWNNILNEDILKSNINFAVMLVLNFEYLKGYIIAQPRNFYSDVVIKDGELCCNETEEYKECFTALVYQCRCYYRRRL